MLRSSGSLESNRVYILPVRGHPPHEGGAPSRLPRLAGDGGASAVCSALAPLRSAAASAACGRWPCLSPGFAPGLGPCGRWPRWPWLGSLRSLEVAPGRSAAGGPPAPVSRPLGRPPAGCAAALPVPAVAGLASAPARSPPRRVCGSPLACSGLPGGRPVRRCGLPCAPCLVAPGPRASGPFGVRLVPPAGGGWAGCARFFAPPPPALGWVRCPGGGLWSLPGAGGPTRPAPSRQGSRRAARGRP